MGQPAAAIDAEIARIQRAAARLDWALSTVAAGALAFSTVTVAALAVEHGVPVPIAWMLEPLVGVALWAALSSDAVLSRYGRASGWRAWALRSFTGAATLTTNIWGQTFTVLPSGGLVFAPDATGIVLHAIAPVLLILLAEAAPRYRSMFAEIIADLTQRKLTSEDHREGDHLAEASQGAAPGDHPLDTAQGAVPGDGERSADQGMPAVLGTRDRARQLVEDDPRISGAELARRLGVQVRTGQRLLNQIRNEKDPQDPPAGAESGEVGEVLR